MRSPRNEELRTFTLLPRTNKHTWLGWSLTWLFAVAYILCAYLAPQATGKIVHCPLHALFGIHCPTCGLTRAFIALINGEPAAAIAHNFLVIPAAAAILAFPLCVITRILRSRIYSRS